MKKFCTVRNGRNVKTDKITRILPQIHEITIVERTNITNNISTIVIDRVVVDDDVTVVRLSRFIKFNDNTVEGEISDIDVKYHSIVLLGIGKSILSFSRSKFDENNSRRDFEIINGTEMRR
jgi:hypothetical protein